MDAGSGTGSTVDPRPKMGGGSKAGSAAGSGGGLLANLPGIYLRRRRASLRRCRREDILLRSRGIYYNVFCLLLTQVSAVETITFPTFFSPIVFRAVHVVESLTM